MPERIQLEIVTPERRIVAEEVDSVTMPGTLGYLGVLPGHAPLLTGLEVGEVSYRVGKQVQYLAVSGGFAEVLRDRVNILADTCEPADEIDVERAQRAKQGAESAMGHPGSADFPIQEVRLRRAVTRIQVHQKRNG